MIDIICKRNLLLFGACVLMTLNTEAVRVVNPVDSDSIKNSNGPARLTVRAPESTNTSSSPKANLDRRGPNLKNIPPQFLNKPSSSNSSSSRSSKQREIQNPLSTEPQLTSSDLTKSPVISTVQSSNLHQESNQIQSPTLNFIPNTSTFSENTDHLQQLRQFQKALEDLHQRISTINEQKNNKAAKAKELNVEKTLNELDKKELFNQQKKLEKQKNSYATKKQKLESELRDLKEKQTTLQENYTILKQQMTNLESTQNNLDIEQHTLEEEMEGLNNQEKNMKFQIPLMEKEIQDTISKVEENIINELDEMRIKAIIDLETIKQWINLDIYKLFHLTTKLDLYSMLENGYRNSKEFNKAIEAKQEYIRLNQLDLEMLQKMAEQQDKN